jgi:uncharacterized surface protein with fasciclin (FAS1) repeats
MAPSVALCTSLVALFVLVSIVHPASAQCNQTLLQAVQANPNLSQLAQVIQQAGLSDKINKTDNVTVLAPNNAAFAALNATLARQNLTLADVSQENNNRAASILLYHILTMNLTASQLLNGQVVETSLQGYNLTVSKTNPTSTTTTVTFVGNANNATVVTPDVPVCNSVVHVVDRVLLPNATLTYIPTYSENDTPTPGVGNGASGSVIGMWTFALSGALAFALLV